MIAPATPYASTPSTRPRPAVSANTASTRPVPTTATSFSTRSSRLRVACTCCVTAAPHEGQRPSRFRTRGAPHPGQSIGVRTGTGADCIRCRPSGKDDGGCATGATLRGVPLRQVRVGLGARTKDDDLAVRLCMLLDCMQPAPQVLGLDTEHVADVLEGEDPGALVALDPLLRVTEHLLPAGVAGACQLAVHIDGVLEHRDHQA